MVTFPFFCPVCLKDADATADPVDILFGGGEVAITCTECKTVFKAEVVDGALTPGKVVSSEPE